MKSLYESIFDIDDNIDNVDLSLFQPLGSRVTFLKTYENLDKYFKKKKWLVGPQKVKEGKVYLVFNRTEKSYPNSWPYFVYSVYLCIPDENTWWAYSISKKEYVNSKYNLPKGNIDMYISYFKEPFFKENFKKARFDTRTIYELPDEYKNVLSVFQQ